MKPDIYSNRQRELLELWRGGSLKRINILEGSVRSGKTWISLVLWAFLVASMPRGACCLMAAKTMTSLRRNCLDLLTELVGKSNFSYSLSRKEGQLFGRHIYFEGVSDSRSENKIRGLTLNAAYCDELSLFSEDFFTMLLSRLSASGAKLIATTNPDSPYHWLMKKYIERRDSSALDLLTMKFMIDDNPFLDRDYIANLKNEYTGVFYDRFIRGLWVAAEGLIYPEAAQGLYTVPPEPDKVYDEYCLSVDYGTLNPCSIGLYGRSGGVWCRFGEFYYSGRDSRVQLTDEDYYSRMEALAADYPVRTVVVDPSASSFIALIRKKSRFTVRPAKNSVVDGIRNTAAAMKNGRLRFSAGCNAILKEFNAYRWDESSVTDRPIKENDHAMDELRYFVQTVIEKPDTGFICI